MTIEHGDFQSNLTLPELRSCLGAGWSEVHAQAQGVDTGDAWVFVHTGAPRVLLVQSHSAGYAHVRWQIVVERASRRGFIASVFYRPPATAKTST